MPTTPSLADAKRACARAEHVLWATILDDRDRRLADIESENTSAMFKRMAVNAVAHDIGRQLRLSEVQVWRIVSQAETIRDHAPTVWAAFADGTLDAARVSIIANALSRTTNPDIWDRVDDTVVDRAVAKTPAELRAWVDQLVERLDPPTLDAAERARADRHVCITAGHHGMSHIQGWVPSIAAAAIDHRLTNAANDLVDEPGDQTRTLVQKRADLFVSWLTNATGTNSNVTAEVAVIIEATALAGVTDTPAQLLTPEGPVPVPPTWVLRMAETGNTLWTRLLTDPTGTVLDVTHHGYQPPQTLRDAIRWRDLTCRVTGCTTPATSCDLDHIQPWHQDGTTTASNLRSLCRRHHGLKGHGLLPEDAYDPPHQHLTRLPTPPITIEYIAA